MKMQIRRQVAIQDDKFTQGGVGIAEFRPTLAAKHFSDGLISILASR